MLHKNLFQFFYSFGFLFKIFAGFRVVLEIFFQTNLATVKYGFAVPATFEFCSCSLGKITVAANILFCILNFGSDFRMVIEILGRREVLPRI